MQQQLHSLAASDYARIKDDTSSLRNVYSKILLIHNPQSKVHQSVVHDPSFSHIGTMPYADRERLLKSIGDKEATPVIARVNDVMTADKCFRDDKFPVEPKACLCRLEALRHSKRRLLQELEAEIETIDEVCSYLKDLGELKRVADEVADALCEPLTGSRKRNRA